MTLQDDNQLADPAAQTVIETENIQSDGETPSQQPPTGTLKQIVCKEIKTFVADYIEYAKNADL